jgi:hypothetical protein
MEKVDLKNESEPLNKRLVTCRCMVCGEEFKGEEPKMCCSGRDCGCMGMPIDPICCSEECYNKLPFRNGR